MRIVDKKGITVKVTIIPNIIPFLKVSIFHWNKFLFILIFPENYGTINLPSRKIGQFSKSEEGL